MESTLEERNYRKRVREYWEQLRSERNPSSCGDKKSMIYLEHEADYPIASFTMPTITIPKKLAQKDDLIVVPRKEYEALKELRKTAEFAPTAAQRKALAKAEQNLKAGKTLSYHKLVRTLGFAD